MSHQVSDLGWVAFDFGYSTVCPVLCGQMRVWQNGLSSWMRLVEHPNQISPTQVSEQMNHPVVTSSLNLGDASYLSEPSSPECNGASFAVLVHSAPANVRLRDAIRDTWGGVAGSARIFGRRLPYMTSALRGEGVPSKADIVSNLSKGGCVNLQTRGVSKNPKLLRTSYMEAP